MAEIRPSGSSTRCSSTNTGIPRIAGGSLVAHLAVVSQDIDRASRGDRPLELGRGGWSWSPNAIVAARRMPRRARVSAILCGRATATRSPARRDARSPSATARPSASRTRSTRVDDFEHCACLRRRGRETPNLPHRAPRPRRQPHRAAHRAARADRRTGGKRALPHGACASSTSTERASRRGCVCNSPSTTRHRARRDAKLTAA